MSEAHFIELSIITEEIHSAELREALTNVCPDAGALPKLEVRRREPLYRGLSGIDASVLVALVSAGGTALGALVTGILKVMKDRQLARIVIEGKGGWRLEVPGDTPMGSIDWLLAKIREFDSQIDRRDT